MEESESISVLGSWVGVKKGCDYEGENELHKFIQSSGL